MKRQRCAFTTPEQPADDMTTYLGLLQRRVEILSSAPPGMKLSQTENGDHFPQPPSTMVFRLSTSVKDVLLMSGHRLSWHSYRQRSQKVISHYQHGVAAYGHFRFLKNALPGTVRETTVLKCNHSSSTRCRCAWTFPFPGQRPPWHSYRENNVEM